MLLFEAASARSEWREDHLDRTGQPLRDGAAYLTDLEAAAFRPGTHLVPQDLADVRLADAALAGDLDACAHRQQVTADRGTQGHGATGALSVELREVFNCAATISVESLNRASPIFNEFLNPVTDETEWRAVGQRVRERRAALGMTQAQLGARIGVANADVSMVEGGASVSEKKLARYASALGVSVPYLRYGRPSEGDADAIHAAGYRAGWLAAFTELRGVIERLAATKGPPAGQGAARAFLDAIPVAEDTPTTGAEEAARLQAERDRAATSGASGAVGPARKGRRSGGRGA